MVTRLWLSRLLPTRWWVAIAASGGKSERVSSCRRYTAFRCDDAMGARALAASAM